jgi:hypothetical protein
MDRNHLVRNKEQWKAFLNTVMTFGFHKQQGIYSAGQGLKARLCRVAFYPRTTIRGPIV